MSWIEVTLESTTFGKKRKTDTESSNTKECTFVFEIEKNQEIMEKIKELIEAQSPTETCNDIKILSIKLVSACSGCREDQPNQLAHMDHGGCLYMDDPLSDHFSQSIPSHLHDE